MRRARGTARARQRPPLPEQHRPAAAGARTGPRAAGRGGEAAAVNYGALAQRWRSWSVRPRTARHRTSPDLQVAATLVLAQVQLELAREIDRLTRRAQTGHAPATTPSRSRCPRCGRKLRLHRDGIFQWRPACHYSLRVTVFNHGSDPRDQDDPRMTMTVKHPEVRVQLTGTDGNAFSILGNVVAAMKAAGVSQGRARRVHHRGDGRRLRPPAADRDAMSGCHERHGLPDIGEGSAELARRAAEPYVVPPAGWCCPAGHGPYATRAEASGCPHCKTEALSGPLTPCEHPVQPGCMGDSAARPSSSCVVCGGMGCEFCSRVGQLRPVSVRA